jgi:hypothetical protein
MLRCHRYLSGLPVRYGNVSDLILHASRPLRTTATMATTSGTSPAVRHKFLVYAPDKTNEDTPAKRMAVRDQHLAAGKKAFEAGFMSESPLIASTKPSQRGMQR